MAKKAGGGKAPKKQPLPPDPVKADKRAFLRWLALIAVLIAAVALLAVSCGRSDTRSSGITASTRQRTKLAEGIVKETEYYTDSLGLIRSRSKLLSGMKYFYKKTGVQPYLYLTDTIGETLSPTEEEMSQAADKLYGSLFRDEGHLLLLFYVNAGDSVDHRTVCRSGSAAQTVADAEACDILLDYIDAYYYNDSRYLSGLEAQLFSDAFENAAKDMMSIRGRAWWIAVLAVLLVLILTVVLIDFRKAWKAQRKAEAEQAKAVLNAQPEAGEDPETRDLLSSLAQKYSVRKEEAAPPSA